MTTADKLLATLVRLSRTLAEETSLDRCLEAVTHAALELLPTDHASIRILDATRTELLSGARSGSGLLPTPTTFMVGDGVAGWVVEHARAVSIPDVDTDDRFKPLENQGFTIGSLMAVPLLSGTQVIGVLAITSPEKGTFDADHLELAKLLANSSIPPLVVARMRRLAVTDYPSGVLRAQMIPAHLESELRRSRNLDQPLTVLYVILDRFDKLHAERGHDQADRLLRAMARRIRVLSRKTDIPFRRHGGEFLLIMPGAHTAEAVDVAEQIRGDIARRPVRLEDSSKLTQTVSVGVATWDEEETPARLEERAAQAAADAAIKGGNVVRAWNDSLPPPPAKRPPSPKLPDVKF